MASKGTSPIRLSPSKQKIVPTTRFAGKAKSQKVASNPTSKTKSKKV